MTSPIEERLLRDPHIVSYEPGKQKIFPEIDLSPYGADAAAFAGECVGQIRNVILGPLITDIFEDHDARRDWRRKLPEEVATHLQSNGLRRGRLSQGIFAAQILVSETEEKTPVLEAHAARMDDYQAVLETLYDVGSSVGKTIFAKAFQHSAYALLQDLAA